MRADTEKHSQALGEKISIWAFLSEPQNPTAEGEERLQESEKMEDTRRTRPTESTKLGTYGSKGLVQQSQDLKESLPDSLSVFCGCQLGVSVTPDHGSRCIFHSFLCLVLGLFLLLGCLVQPWCEGFALSCCISFCHISLLFFFFLEVCSFLKRDGRIVDLGVSGSWLGFWEEWKKKKKCGQDILFDKRIYFK